MNYLVSILMPLTFSLEDIRTRKNVVLLGDGFFARGFLHHINHGTFHVTQIYRDKFINPQDMMYALQQDQQYESGWHFRDLFTRSPKVKIQTDIKDLKIFSGVCKVNQKGYFFDHLVVGLGSSKPLTDWKDTVNTIVTGSINPKTIIGMGPTGMEFASILSKKGLQEEHDIHVYDMQSISNVMNYVSLPMKMCLLSNKNIQFHFNARSETTEPAIVCVGSRPNFLTQDWKVTNNLTLEQDSSVHVGGDCANTTFYKTGQVAYQQGVYVAKKLNGEIQANEPFVYKPQGIALNMGDDKTIIEGHPYFPDGVYPAFIVKLYSLFFV
jgi:NADH dehydrogenase FAD-containing subunit